jgi:hypothetical protein
MVNGKRCERRVQKLYLPPRGRYYGCRHCYQFSYESRNQNVTLRAIAKVQKIRRRLGGGASLLELFPEKPRGMWWRTYRRLSEEAQRAEERTSPPAAMMKYLDKLVANTHASVVRPGSLPSSAGNGRLGPGGDFRSGG